MSQWRSVPFENLYLEPSRSGVNRPTRVRGSGFKMINMGELFSYGRIKNPPMELVPLDDEEIEKYGVLEGDLLFARQSLVASGAGKCSIALYVPEVTTFEGHLIRVRLDQSRSNPLFYYYYFFSPQGTGNVQSLVMQVAAAGIRGSELSKLKVPYPPLLTQCKIAGILSAYDNLIEKNTRRIALLEEMAQLIYREWFVRFRFPGHEGVKMVNSELGLIPEGWRLVTLEEMLDNLHSGSRPKGGIDPNEQEIPSIGAENILGLGKYDFTKEKYVSRDFYEGMKRGHIQSGDVLLYKDGAKIGRKTLFRDGFPHYECSINEHVFILRANELCTQNYLYFWLDLPTTTQKIINLNTNAAQPGINQKKVKGLHCLLPTKGVIDEFEEIIEPLLRLLFNRAKQNFSLRQTRDLLLPRLISGELDVTNSENAYGPCQ